LPQSLTKKFFYKLPTAFFHRFFLAKQFSSHLNLGFKILHRQQDEIESSNGFLTQTMAPMAGSVPTYCERGRPVPSIALLTPQ
jgi:hypothetical protein